MKDVSTKESLNSPNASRIQMASDAVQAIKQLRKEIFNIMEKLLALAKLKQSSGMIQLAEEMVTRTRTLLTLWDPGLMEEVLAFVEWHKVPVNEKPSDGIQVILEIRSRGPVMFDSTQICPPEHCRTFSGRVLLGWPLARTRRFLHSSRNERYPRHKYVTERFDTEV